MTNKIQEQIKNKIEDIDRAGCIADGPIFAAVITEEQRQLIAELIKLRAMFFEMQSLNTDNEKERNLNIERRNIYMALYQRFKA